MRAFLLLLVAGVLSSTVAFAYKIQAIQLPDQELRYDHGDAMLVSQAPNSTVRVLPHANGPHGRMIFTVLAYNKGTTPFNLGYDNVLIQNDKGAVRLFTIDEIEKEAQKAANWRRFAIGMAAGLQAASAAQQSSYSSSGTVYGSRGYANFYSSGSSYNPALTSIAESQIQAQAASNFQAINNNLDAYMGEVSSRILQITTIDPGAANGGAVFADRPNFAKGEDRTIKVVVTIGSDRHEFSFTVAD